MSQHLEYHQREGGGGGGCGGGERTQKWLLRLVAGFQFEKFHYWMLNLRSVIHMKVTTSITRPYVPYNPMYN